MFVRSRAWLAGRRAQLRAAVALAFCLLPSGCGITPRTSWRPLEVASYEVSEASQSVAKAYLTSGKGGDKTAAICELNAQFAAGARDARVSFSLAELNYAAALEDEKASRETCVDRYLLAAAYSWHCLFACDCPTVVGEPPREQQTSRCASLYNSSTAKFVESAQRFSRFESPTSVRICTPSGPARVAVEWLGFTSPTDRVERLMVVGDYEADELTRRYRRTGMGAPMVAWRRRADDAPAEQFLPERLPMAATAVLRPGLGVLLGSAPPAGEATIAEAAKLEFYDSARVSSVVVAAQSSRHTPCVATGGSCARGILSPTGRGEDSPPTVAGRPIGLAGDLSAPWALTLLDPSRSRLEYGGFFRPEETADATGLYMLEPYQPGKIPVVMVHGLISGPWTWTDVINELRADLALRDRYQLWVFRYPTGGPLLHAAARLRSELRAVRQTFDPGHADPALDHMVLFGYSLGGLIAKLQVSYGGDELWAHYASRPLDSLRLSAADRCRLEPWFYFEPEPYITRVVFFATPNRGTRTRNQYAGRLASNFVRLPEASEMTERVAQANPGAFRVTADQLLATSVDLLSPDDVLSTATRRLPAGRDVRIHTVIGAGQKLWGGEDSDGVVTVESARLAGAASECLVPAEHALVHRHPQTIAEIKRILREHLAAP